jgi:hypothetical protein
MLIAQARSLGFHALKTQYFNMRPQKINRQDRTDWLISLKHFGK